MTLALNQNPHARPTSMDVIRITLNQGESSTDLDDDVTKPGTPGIFVP